MKAYTKTNLFGDVFEHESYIENARTVRISPRCYRNGEIVGFYCGIAVGFISGIMFICFSLGVL